MGLVCPTTTQRLVQPVLELAQQIEVPQVSQVPQVPQVPKVPEVPGVLEVSQLVQPGVLRPYFPRRFRTRPT